MTNFLASYFLLAIAIIILTLGLVFKLLWLYYVSGISWILTGIYYISVAGANQFVDYLGIFCVLAGVSSFFIPIMLRQKKVEQTVVKKTRAEQLDETTDKYRKARGRGKVAQGWWQKQ